MLPMMANTAAPNGPDLSQTVTRVRPLPQVTTQQRGISDTELLTDTARKVMLSTVYVTPWAACTHAPLGTGSQRFLM